VLVWKLPKPEVPKPEEPKWWGMMMSPGGDVDPERLSSSKIQSSERFEESKRKIFRSPKFEVTWLTDVTWDDVDTWDVCHVSVSFEPMED
jgi:hypothetical protein